MMVNAGILINFQSEGLVFIPSSDGAAAFWK
jgi:hypothetical protein